eukprot:g13797.t1
MSAPVSSNQAAAASGELVIQLTTKISDPAFHVPEEALVVPASLTRYGLSELMNRPLQIEYVWALPPFSTSENDCSEDWISCVRSCEKSQLVLAAAYDGALRVFKQNPPVEGHVGEGASRAGAPAGDNKDASEAGGSLSGSSSSTASKETTKGEKNAAGLELLATTQVSAKDTGLTFVEVIDVEVVENKDGRADVPRAVRVVLGDKDGVVRFGKVLPESGEFLLCASSKEVEETDDKTSAAYEKAVECVAVSGKKQLVATGGWDWAGGVKIWNVADVFAAGAGAATSIEEKKTSLKRLSAAAVCSASSSDETRKEKQKGVGAMATAEFVVDTSTINGSGREQVKNRVTGLLFLDEVRLIVSSLDATVRVVDLVSNRVIPQSVLHTGLAVCHIAFSPRANLLACAHESGRLSFWDVVVVGGEDATPGTGGAEGARTKVSFKMAPNLPVLKLHQGAISSLRFLPDGNRILSAGLDGQVKVSDARSSFPLQTIKVEESRDGGSAAAAGKAKFPLKVTTVCDCAGPFGTTGKTEGEAATMSTLQLVSGMLSKVAQSAPRGGVRQLTAARRNRSGVVLQQQAGFSSSTQHRVAILGFGTVGKGFAEIVKAKNDMLKAKYDLDVKIVAVSDFHKGSVYAADGLSVAELLEWDAAGKSLNDFGKDKTGYKHELDALQTCKDVEADSLLEMTWTNLEDGTPAISHVETCLNHGKNVITTNKGPVVFAYDKLDALARSKGLRFMIEGSFSFVRSIVSGTPIVSLMRNMPACDYTEISGILNGTCNYILSSMEFDGVDFDTALKEAQRLGYAEANPSFDVGGGDARAKAIILCRMLKDTFPTDKIELEGITEVTKQMVDEAKAQGKRYKLVSTLKFDAASQKITSIAVKPTMLDTKADSLANVGGALNALNFKTDMLGPDLTIIGPGAGKVETGYSLFTDLMYLCDAGKRAP